MHELAGEFLNTANLLLPGLNTVVQVFALAIAAAGIISPFERIAPAFPQGVLHRKGLGYGIIVGAAFLGEIPSWRIIAGAVVIFAAIACSSHSNAEHFEAPTLN